MFVTMIKKSLVVAMGLVAALSVSAEAKSSASSCVSYSAPSPIASSPFSGPFSGASSGSGILSGDPVGPFPLSALMPFPWGSIDGIWSMKLPDGTRIHLSFEVQSACDGRKLVQVLGFDQKSYRVTSEGVGISDADAMVSGKDTTVRAVMSSSTSQYTVFIRQFRMPPGKATGRISTVVSLRPFNGSQSDDLHMVARRSSPLTLPEYIDRQKEIEAKRDDAIRKKLESRGR